MKGEGMVTMRVRSGSVVGRLGEMEKWGILSGVYIGGMRGVKDETPLRRSHRLNLATRHDISTDKPPQFFSSTFVTSTKDRILQGISKHKQFLTYPAQNSPRRPNKARPTKPSPFLQHPEPLQRNQHLTSGSRDGGRGRPCPPSRSPCRGSPPSRPRTSRGSPSGCCSRGSSGSRSRP